MVVSTVVSHLRDLGLSLCLFKCSPHVIVGLSPGTPVSTLNLSHSHRQTVQKYAELINCP